MKKVIVFVRTLCFLFPTVMFIRPSHIHEGEGIFLMLFDLAFSFSGRQVLNKKGLFL